MTTPTKAAGIDLKLGHDKWDGLIKQAQNTRRQAQRLGCGKNKS
jgi:hypothetical protein